jgi:hypothetical protein
MPMLWRSAVIGAGLLAVSAGLPAHADGGGGFDGGAVKQVLLISIDGMHALDFINCAEGISGVNGGAAYCPNLAELARDGGKLSRHFDVEAVRLVPRIDGAGQRRLAAYRRRIL